MLSGPKEQDYEIEDNKDAPVVEETESTPSYLEQLKLSDDDKNRLSEELELEKDAIEKEYEDAGYPSKWIMLNNQYEGNLLYNEDQQFNLHKPITKVKCDTIVRYLKKAFLKTDPIFSVSSRPEYEKEGGEDVCEKQQDYLDYKLDLPYAIGGIPFRKPAGRAFHNAVVKNGGLIKVERDFKIQPRKRNEKYEGNPIYTIARYNAETDEAYQIQIKHKDFKELSDSDPNVEVIGVENEGLEAFMRMYPDAEEKYPAYVKKLMDAQSIDIVVSYDEIVYDDPILKNVLPENFRVRLAVDGYEGMKYTRLTTERKNYSWWDLKKAEEKGQFNDINALTYEYEKTGKGYKGNKVKEDKNIRKSNYENETWDILECVYYFKMNEDDKDGEEQKIIAWRDDESGRIIGCIRYPDYGIDCHYFPFFVLDKWEGFWQPGIAEYLTDMNLAENGLLNFTLESAVMRNMITPITENEEIIEQFIEKSWTHGIPLKAKTGEVDFLQKYMQQMDIGGILGLAQTLTRQEDDVSGVQGNITGRESELDPTAPGNKTLALLRQSGINIEEYIENMLPMFNMLANAILQITYHITEEGRRYSKRDKSGKPEDIFGDISREDMVARTNIQSQAMSFAFDELNEKRENLALYSTIRFDPLVARNPEAVYKILKAIIKAWSPKWKNLVDQILPSLEQFKADQMQVAVKAVAMYIETKAQQSQNTGEPLNFDPMEVLTSMNEAMAQVVTPIDEKAVKEKKGAENAR